MLLEVAEEINVQQNEDFRINSGVPSQYFFLKRKYRSSFNVLWKNNPKLNSFTYFYSHIIYLANL